MRTDKDSVFEGHAMVYGDIILDFNIIPDGNISVHVDPFAENAILAQSHSLPHLAMVPDAGAISDYSFR
jgi:hypothetical protein